MTFSPFTSNCAVVVSTDCDSETASGDARSAAARIKRLMDGPSERASPLALAGERLALRREAPLQQLAVYRGCMSSHTDEDPQGSALPWSRHIHRSSPCRSRP